MLVLIRGRASAKCLNVPSLVDIPIRKSSRRNRRTHTIVNSVIGIIAISIIAFGVLRLSPAAPSEPEWPGEVVFMVRPVSSQAFKLISLDSDGNTATRARVKIGRSWLTAVEILDGVRPGGRAVIFDPSAFDKFEHIRLN